MQRKINDVFFIHFAAVEKVSYLLRECKVSLSLERTNFSLFQTTKRPASRSKYAHNYLLANKIPISAIEGMKRVSLL